MVIGSGVAYPIIHTTSDLGLEAARLGHNTGIEVHLVCWSNMPPLTMSDTRVAQYIGGALVRGKVVGVGAHTTQGVGCARLPNVRGSRA